MNTPFSTDTDVKAAYERGHGTVLLFTVINGVKVGVLQKALELRSKPLPYCSFFVLVSLLFVGFWVGPINGYLGFEI